MLSIAKSNLLRVFGIPDFPQTQMFSPRLCFFDWWALGHWDFNSWAPFRLIRLMFYICLRALCFLLFRKKRCKLRKKMASWVGYEIEWHGQEWTPRASHQPQEGLCRRLVGRWSLAALAVKEDCHIEVASWMVGTTLLMFWGPAKTTPFREDVGWIGWSV